MQHRMRMCSGMHRIQYILHGGKRNLLGEKNKDMSATMYTEGQAILAKLAKARLVGCTTCRKWSFHFIAVAAVFALLQGKKETTQWMIRSEEHTSELQSRQYLVCRLLLEKKKQRSLVSAFSLPDPTR